MRFSGTQIATISAAGLALLGSVVSGFYTYTNRNRELDIKLIEIGIGILRADPKETGLTPARAWAVNVIEQSSQVKFSEADRLGLLQNPLRYTPTVILGSPFPGNPFDVPLPPNPFRPPGPPTNAKP
jgi:hypothetical protein